MSQRARLNRSRVLGAAVSLADAQGLSALNMRDLAEHLGVVPMALYKHVANKEDLIDGMVDTVLEQLDPPEVPEHAWRPAVRGRVLAARSMLVAHPWVRPAIETRTTRTPTVLAHMDWIAGRFLAGGFSADLTHHVMHALGNRIWGFSPELFNPPPSDTAATPPPPSNDDGATAQLAQRFPAIAAIAAAATQDDPGRHGCDEQFEFEFALDLLLDAFERLHEQGWRSSDARAVDDRSADR